jgi:acyl carrier protein
MDVFSTMTAVFMRVFDDDSIKLYDAATAQDVPGWDSLTHINLIIEIEEEFGLKFTVDDISDLKNVGEMVAMVEKKLATKHQDV